MAHWVFIIIFIMGTCASRQKTETPNPLYLMELGEALSTVTGEADAAAWAQFAAEFVAETNESEWLKSKS